MTANLLGSVDIKKIKKPPYKAINISGRLILNLVDLLTLFA